MKTNVEFLDELETRARASDSLTLGTEELLRLVEIMSWFSPPHSPAGSGRVMLNSVDLVQAVFYARSVLAECVKRELLE